MKKSLNKFEQYDKIEEDKGIIKKEIFYETIEKEIQMDKEALKNSAVKTIEKDRMDRFNKTVKLIDKIIESEEVENNLRVRVIFVVEQDIALPQKVQ